MFERITTLSPERTAAFESYAETVRQRALDAVESLLVNLDPALAQTVYDLSFAQNDVLPRRGRRPDLHSAVLADAAADAVGLEEDVHLLAFTVAIQEYYDLLDDVVDGDVPDGREGAVQIVAQTLLPLAVGRLARLGDDAVAYWSRAATELIAAPHAESRQTPSADAYLELLDRQSVLFGFVPGVAAVAAGRDDGDVERAEALGRAVYRFDQLLRDYEQHASGDDDPWNAAALLGAEEVFAELESARADVVDYTSGYEDPARRRLRALVAVDLASVRSGDSEG